MGEQIKPGSLILSNHEGTASPLTFEIFLNEPITFWGAYQMNGSLVSLYKYQTKDYYHGKKHWPLWAARLFCLTITFYLIKYTKEVKNGKRKM